jgi:AcrR family transcriptional regulator
MRSRRPSPSQPIWASPSPSRRKPRFSRDQIASAALRIADQEGFAAVSMRRVADALGAGTMTLYYYVRTKDDLVTLMDDAVMAKALVSEAALQRGWRPALTAIARQTRDVFVSHPWALYELRGVRIGPNGMRHVEQSVAAVADCPLDTRGRMRLLGLLDDFTFGHVLRATKGWSSPGPSAAERRAIGAFMIEQMKTGSYPHLERLLGRDDPMARAAATIGDNVGSNASFQAGLKAILDSVRRS